MRSQPIRGIGRRIYAAEGIGVILRETTYFNGVTSDYILPKTAINYLRTAQEMQNRWRYSPGGPLMAYISGADLRIYTRSNSLSQVMSSTK